MFAAKVALSRPTWTLASSCFVLLQKFWSQGSSETLATPYSLCALDSSFCLFVGDWIVWASSGFQVKELQASVVFLKWLCHKISGRLSRVCRHPEDVYALNILEAPKSRKASCVAADPNNTLCQLCPGPQWDISN